MDTVYNVIGLSGVVMMLAAYFLLQLGKLKMQDAGYSWLNFIGALAVLFSLIRFWNLSSFVIEVAWALISLYGLIKCYRTSTKSPL